MSRPKLTRPPPVTPLDHLSTRLSTAQALARTNLPGARQIRSLAEEYATRLVRAQPELRTRVAHLLADTVLPAAPAPPKHLATVGDLRRLLANIPDSTPLRDIQSAPPGWLAQAADILSLIPAVSAGRTGASASHQFHLSAGPHKSQLEPTLPATFEDIFGDIT